MIYLSGVTNAPVRAAAERWPIGLMAQPGNSLHLQIGAFRWWGADNGCFAKGEAFDVEEWLAWLAALPRDRCLFAVAPDVVGDAVATWARSEPYLPVLRDMGFPAALVTQDGFDAAAVDWTSFDCLFTGGTDEWKLSEAAHAAAAEAKRRGKWVHMGRVNSWKRVWAAASSSYDSVDGTFLKWTDRRLPELIGWLRRLEDRPPMRLEAV